MLLAIATKIFFHIETFFSSHYALTVTNLIGIYAVFKSILFLPRWAELSWQKPGKLPHRLQVFERPFNCHEEISVGFCETSHHH